MLVAAFYKFTPIAEPQVLREFIKSLGERLNLLGTVLIANEGINSTLSGEPASIEQFFQELQNHPDINSLTIKYSETEESPFHRWKVKIKPEIVTMGIPSIDPNQLVGTYVTPEAWNNLIQDPDVTLIDCRNHYEFIQGTFDGAINPETESFTQFPEYIKENLKDPNQKVAMFCTGGIRCEKATAYLRQLGHNQVFHLQGGILKYLEEIPPKDSLFQGTCFIFDDRRTLDHDLKPTYTETPKT